MLRYLISLIVVAITLSACGADSADSAASSTANAAVDEVDNSVVSGETNTSPLEAQLGFPSDPGRRQHQLVTMQRDADASLVQCMRNAGFFYAVGDDEKSLRSGAAAGDGTREWVELHGLGITSSFIDAVKASTLESAPDADATNLGYVASLTPEQAAQYDVALIGDIAVLSTSAEYEPAGCWGAAFDDILGLLAFTEAFEPELESLNSRLQADPRVQRFQQVWSDCMDAAGYRYANESAMVDEFYAELLEIELVDDGVTTAVASAEALDTLITLERQVGLASHDCGQSYQGELAALRHDYEREFLDDNRFRIADMRRPAQ